MRARAGRRLALVALLCVLALACSLSLYRGSAKRRSAKIVALVLSAPENRARRDAIRQTWARLAPDSVDVRFVVGDGAYAGERDDLIVLDGFEDSYGALALKLRLAIARCLKEYPALEHAIKCDDDSFVRVDALAAELSAKRAERGLYWGYFRGDARPRPRGRWAESSWFLCDRYLPYAMGGGYVVSRRILDFVALNGALLETYSAEDVTMGVWTAALSGLERVHDARFDTEWTSRGCDDAMLVRHKQSADDMRRAFERLERTDGAKMCADKYEHRPAHDYDWKAPPSRCCQKRLR